MTDQTVTIATSELLRVISDVLPFVPSEKTDPHHGVLLEWTKGGQEEENGGVLYASATDVLSGGVSLSDCDPGPLSAKEEDLYGHVAYGGDDVPDWRIFISFADARQILTVFKVAAAHRAAPLDVSVNVSQTRLTIRRYHDDQTPLPGAQLLLATPDAGIPAAFPRVMDQYFSAFAESSERAFGGDEGMCFAPWRLARFGTVQGEDMRLFYAGPDRASAVQVGTRFNGFIYPINAKLDEEAVGRG